MANSLGGQRTANLNISITFVLKVKVFIDDNLLFLQVVIFVNKKGEYILTADKEFKNLSLLSFHIFLSSWFLLPFFFIINIHVHILNTF